MKPVHFLGNTKTVLRGFPAEVKDRVGYALYEAQRGEKAANTKPLKGFHGASVLEVVENYDGSTYRAVYTIRFSNAVYVLHTFQKKSKKGIATPKQDIELVKPRLKLAEEDSRKETQS
jgi:phage-related protein